MFFETFVDVDRYEYSGTSYVQIQDDSASCLCRNQVPTFASSLSVKISTAIISKCFISLIILHAKGELFQLLDKQVLVSIETGKGYSSVCASYPIG